MPNDTTLALREHPSGISTDPRRNALALDPFEPQTMEDLFKFAECVAGTDFAPKEFRGKPESCFVAMVYGRSLGVGALQSIQNIAVINGKPSTYSDLYWALIISHPEFEDAQEEVDADHATIVLKRRGRSPRTATFTMKDAVTADLTSKDPWKKYPQQMLMWRARHIAGSALFADALKGITPREVAQDFVTIEGDTTPAKPTPLTAVAATSAPAPAKTGDQPKPAERAAEADRVITDAELTEWNNVRKAAKWTVAEAKLYIEALGLKRSGEMRISQLPAAMEWARKGPPVQDEPVKPAEQPKAADPEPSDGPNLKQVEEACRDAMNKGQMGMFEQNALIGRFTKDAVTDWGAVADDLNQKGLM